MLLILSLFVLKILFSVNVPGFIPLYSNNRHFAPSRTIIQKIKYNIGGPVLTNPLNIYFIYYGDFDLEQRDILEDFVISVDQSGNYKRID